MVAGRPHAGVLLAIAVVIMLATMTLNAAAAMYEARQQTRRKEIECRSADTLAAALARCIDDAHTKAQNLSGAKKIEEAARVRASASQLLTGMSPAILTLLGQPTGQACRRPIGIDGHGRQAGTAHLSQKRS